MRLFGILHHVLLSGLHLFFLVVQELLLLLLLLLLLPIPIHSDLDNLLNTFSVVQHFFDL